MPANEAPDPSVYERELDRVAARQTSIRQDALAVLAFAVVALVAVGWQARESFEEALWLGEFGQVVTAVGLGAATILGVLAAAFALTASRVAGFQAFTDPHRSVPPLARTEYALQETRDRAFFASRRVRTAQALLLAVLASFSAPVGVYATRTVECDAINAGEATVAVLAQQPEQQAPPPIRVICPTGEEVNGTLPVPDRAATPTPWPTSLRLSSAP